MTRYQRGHEIVLRESQIRCVQSSRSISSRICHGDTIDRSVVCPRGRDISEFLKNPSVRRVVAAIQDDMARLIPRTKVGDDTPNRGHLIAEITRRKGNYLHPLALTSTPMFSGGPSTQCEDCPLERLGWQKMVTVGHKQPDRENIGRRTDETPEPFLRRESGTRDGRAGAETQWLLP